MANLLALEWDRDELRIAAASMRGSAISVQHANIVELDEAVARDDQALAKFLAEYLAKHQLGRSEAIAVLGRAGLELRMLSVPPVPENELPDIVRFQAVQQFTNMGDDWPLDFVPTDVGPEGARQVLAAAVAPELLKQACDICEAAQLRPRGVVLRASGSAALVRHQLATLGEDFALVIELLDGAVDLTVLNQHTILVVRTVRLPHTDSDTSRQQLLLNEVRRTLAAARTHLKGRPIHQVLLLQDDAFHGELKAEIEQKIKIPAQIIDPFDGLSRPGRSSSADVPQHMERLAPLLGVLVDELHQRPHAIDFLRPKRTVEPPDRRRLWTVAGLVAAMVLLTLLGGLWWSLQKRDAEIARLQKTSLDLDKQVETVQKQTRLLEMHDQWLNAAPNWLVELNQLSRRLPPPDQLRLYDLNANIMDGTQGVMTLKGLVDDSHTVTLLEEVLRDSRYAVMGEGRYLVGDDPLPWHFEERVILQDISDEDGEVDPEQSSEEGAEATRRSTAHRSEVVR